MLGGRGYHSSGLLGKCLSRSSYARTNPSLSLIDAEGTLPSHWIGDVYRSQSKASDPLFLYPPFVVRALAYLTPSSTSLIQSLSSHASQMSLMDVLRACPDQRDHIIETMSEFLPELAQDLALTQKAIRPEESFVLIPLLVGKSSILVLVQMSQCNDEKIYISLYTILRYRVSSGGEGEPYLFFLPDLDLLSLREFEKAFIGPVQTYL